ncbi:hypothetical protein [Bosea sp. (in: a-proteobacteria)]|mgnify:CR=1 FL=1|uniref:hypothetical protein n=1 Tax=Bosea sp. (in: a-proteobacteria) TaxID=1871050 RepID=UPI001AD54114|nr:hypothetical protein [Bosea sp. (in: a-proteobacteria)]MBN9438980.1 hypothetical protein [Bosea sp. (in: a-proteobacteria)]
MARKSYPVLSNLQHDGRDYGPAHFERAIVLEEKVAGPLIDAGVLGEGEEVGELEGEDRTTALVQFVQTLAIDDFTIAGSLRVDAKRRAVAALGFDPTDDELKDAIAAAKRQPGSD